MIKIRALNRESVSDEEAPTIRREAQEEILLEQYNIALRNQAKTNYLESIAILQKLVEENIPELENNGGLPKSMSTIKFSCHFNLGNNYLKLNNVNKALENYSTAAELDSTDVTLWCKIGKLSLKEDQFRKAAYAFSKGLECSESHWPCLDNLISVLYAIKDTVTCLVYIGKALILDADYTKGLVLRKQIYENNPATKKYYQLYNPEYIWEPPLDVHIDEEDEKLVIEESQKLCDRVTETEKALGPKRIETIPLPKALEDHTWVALANCLTGLHQYITDNEMSHFTMIDLSKCMSQSSDSEKSLLKLEITKPENLPSKSENNSQESRELRNEEKTSKEEKDPGDKANENLVFNEKAVDSDVEVMDIEASDNERRGSLLTESLPDGQDNGTPVQTDNDEEQAIDIDNDIETDGENQKPERGRPRGSKRKRDVLSDLQIWGWHSKRKQPKKATKDYTIEDALNRIIPKSLLHSKITPYVTLTTTEDSMNTMDLYHMYIEDKELNFISPIHSPKSVNYEAYFGTDREKDDILQFWNKERECVDAVTLIKELVFKLSTIWHYKWPSELIPLYLKAFSMFREHCDPPQLFCSGLPFEKIREDALATLLCTELSVFGTEHGKDISPTAIGYLQLVSGWQDDWNEEFVPFFTRFYWLHSHIFRKNNENDLAINTLEMILEVFNEEEEKTKEKYSLNIPNCLKYGFVTKQIVEKIIKHLNMINALTSIENLYNAEKYAEVADIIKQTFSAGSSFSKVGRMGRPAQLGLLLHSLWFSNLEECFIYCEECLYEAVQNSFKPNSDKDKWEKVVDKCLSMLHEIIKRESITVVDLLTEQKRCRLVESLSKIICCQLNSEYALIIPLETITPWLLMHFILLRDEQRQYASKRKSMSKRDKVESPKGAKEDSSEENEEELPPSIAILFSAHEFLGPKGWCLINNGELLLFILDTVLDRLDTPVFESIKEKLEVHIEQALFCLYLYPSKKNKISRHLVDHNVSPIPLTWERSFQLYQYYGPDTLPEYNDLKSASISADLENLLRRIIALVPNISDLHNHLPKIMSYIYNKTDEMPAPLDFPTKLCAIYYLIADYHFKQGDCNRCIKYYQLDLCINPERLDSWACLALSYASQLEQKLNHCEDIKSDTDFLEKARSAEKCFRRALELNSALLTLWIERGSFEYTVHAICSRMIKYDSENYSMEKFEILENEKETFLDNSGESLQTAIGIYETEDNGEADERWLQYYILGKISEKKKQEPNEFLQYYLTACNLLHENKATYPDKINYNNPQHLSVEALEMHYRIHASVLKYLELHEGKEIANTLGHFFKRCIGVTAEYFKPPPAPPPPPPVIESEAKNQETEPLVNMDAIIKDVRTCLDEVIDKVEDKLYKEKEQSTKIETIEIKMDEDDDVVIIEDTDYDVIILDSDEEAPKEGDVVVDQNDTSKKETDEKPGNEEKDNLTEEKSSEVMQDESSKKPENHTTDQSEEIKQKEDIESNKEVIPMETDPVQEKENVSKITDVQSFLDKMMEQTMKNVGEIDDANDSYEKVEEVTLPKEDSLDPDNGDKAENKKNEVEADRPPKTKTPNPETDTDTVKNSATENDSSSTSASSSSSSDSSSSDSDNDSSSSDSSSSDGESSEHMSNSEVAQLVDKCIQGLEDCCLRLEGNYKALYRLAHVFFNYKNRKDYTKCKQILLGEYRTKDGRSIQGLFFERKMNNFFNGIWRIPCTEIDRPGSLAAHMNRCIGLLLQVLRNTNDNKTLIELCLQLKKEPDKDKIYIKNSDRLTFSEQAMNMCLQSFRGQIKNMPNMSSTQMIKLLHDIFRVYQKIQKHFTSKEGLISSLLVDAYKSFNKEKLPDNVNVLELAVKFCQQHRPLEKHRNSSTNSLFVGRSPGVGTSPVLPSPSTFVQQNSMKRSTVNRPRGRPPLPKVNGQPKQSKSKSSTPSTIGGAGAWPNQNFTYEYLKQYQEQLIKQYSQNLTYNQMAQLSQMMTQGQLNNPAMASAVANQLLAGTGLLSSSGLLSTTPVSSSSLVNNTVPTTTSLLDNQNLIKSVFNTGASTSSLSGMSMEQMKYLETLIKTMNQSKKQPFSYKTKKYSSSKSPRSSSKLSKDFNLKNAAGNKTANTLMKERPSISITPVSSTATTTVSNANITISGNKQDLTITPSLLGKSTVVTTATFTASKSSSLLMPSSSKPTTITSSSSTKSSSYSNTNPLHGMGPLTFGLPNPASVSKSIAQSSLPFGIPTVNFGMPKIPNIGATITPSSTAYLKNQNIHTSPKTSRASVVMNPSRSPISTAPSATHYVQKSPTSFTKPSSTSPGKTLQEKLAEKKKEQSNYESSTPSANLLKTLNIPSLPSNLSVSMASTSSTFSQAEIKSGSYPAFGVDKLPTGLSMSKTNSNKEQSALNKVAGSGDTLSQVPSKGIFEEKLEKRHASPSSRPVSVTNEVEITVSPQSSKISPKNDSSSPTSVPKSFISVKKDLFALKPNSNETSTIIDTPIFFPGAVKSVSNVKKSFKSKISSNRHKINIPVNIGLETTKNAVSVIKPAIKSQSVTPETQKAIKTLKSLPSINLSVNAPKIPQTKNSNDSAMKKDEDVICID